MTTDLFLASVEGLIKELEGRARRVQNSLSILQHQDSSYAQDHRALIAAYDDALAALRRHRDEATNAQSPILKEPTGPPCPVCCRPSWPMSENGKLWRCSAPGCVVSSFATLDEFGRPHSYKINGREVLSMDGAQQVARESCSGKDPNPRLIHLLTGY